MKWRYIIGIVILAIFILLAAGAYAGFSLFQPFRTVTEAITQTVIPSPTAVTQTIYQSPTSLLASTPFPTITLTSAIASSSDVLTWAIPSQKISQAEVQHFKAAVLELIQRVDSNGNSELKLTDADVQDTWAVFYGETKAKKASKNLTGSPVVLLAHKTDTGWQIFSPGEAKYCQLLPQVPDSLLSQEDKRYIGCSST